MAGRFIVDELRHGEYGIGWLEDGDCDAHLGQSPDDGDGPEPQEREHWEWWKASKIVLDMGAVRSSVSYAYVFDAKARADAALKRIKLELAQERPMPDWAKKALDEGWKAPKGWKA